MMSWVALIVSAFAFGFALWSLHLAARPRRLRTEQSCVGVPRLLPDGKGWVYSADERLTPLDLPDLPDGARWEYDGRRITDAPEVERDRTEFLDFIERTPEPGDG